MLRHILTKPLLLFTKSYFPLPVFVKSRHGDYLLKKHSNQSLNTWSARARDLNFTVTLSSSTRAFAPQHRGRDTQGCLGDAVLAEILGAQGTLLTGICPFQDCPDLGGFQSTVLLSTKSFFTTLFMIMRDFLQTLCALSAR